MTAAFPLPWGKQRCIMQSRELGNNFNKPDAAKHDRFHAHWKMRAGLTFKWGNESLLYD
jgi:hypothetical protein